MGYLTLGSQAPRFRAAKAGIKLVTELSKGARRRPTDAAETESTRCMCWISPPGVCTWPEWRSWNVLAPAGCRRPTPAVRVEHNLDVHGEADWISTLGPEAGDGGRAHRRPGGAGGRRAPRRKHSHTGPGGEDFLRQRTGRRRRRRYGRHPPPARARASGSRLRSSECARQEKPPTAQSGRNAHSAPPGART